MEVKHNPQEERFEWEQENLLSVIDYKMKGNTMVFVHTGVPPQLEGRGIAAKMAAYALDYAREHHLTILPLCPYMKVYVDRHPAYQDLLKKQD